MTAAIVMDFMHAWMTMPDDAICDTAIIEHAGRRLLVVSSSDPAGEVESAAIGMPADDARALADICWETVQKFPSQDHLASLVMALRYGADRLEAQ